MRSKFLASVAAATLSIFSLSGIAAHAETFTLQGSSATGLTGVSPFAMALSPTTDRVFYSGGMSGWSMATCTVGGTCAGATLPFGFGTDYTQVTLKDGSQRAYFIEPSPSVKTISTAPVSYDAAGQPQLGAKTSLGISSPAGQKAWGVPDSVVLPDGRVRLYWVAMPDGNVASKTQPTSKQLKCLSKKLSKARIKAISSGAKLSAKDKKALKTCKINASLLGSGSTSGSGANEVILSATSTDTTGTSFVQDAGYRFTGGYVDSAIIQADAGKWIALVSTGPGAPPQRLYAATSTDGLTWKVNTKALTGTNVNSLDPTAVKTGANTWRVYYSQSPASDPFSNQTVVVGNLTLK
jgi:hypothetical protein